MKRFGIPVLAVAVLFTAPMAIADPLRDAASNAVECRGLTDAAARLACFDATSGPLADALASAEAPLAEAAPEPDTPSWAAAPEPRETEVAEAPQPAPVPEAAPVPAATAAAAPTEPSWAAAPAPPPEPQERVREAREFTATIVRITRNQLGRHKFYTDDGAIWEQTQIEEIRPPRSLPAEAEFRRRLTGNPTITFDTSRKAYRVRRIQ